MKNAEENVIVTKESQNQDLERLSLCVEHARNRFHSILLLFFCFGGLVEEVLLVIYAKDFEIET